MSGFAQAPALLRDGRFFRIWMIGFVAGIARWLELLVLGIYAFETTGSPFLVALLVILRMLPMSLFGSLVGTLADRFEPARLLAIGTFFIAVVAFIMAVCFYLDIVQYWQIALATFLSGLIWTTDMPLRRRILGEIAGPERLTLAMGLDAATNNITRMFGPLFGGLLYQFVGGFGAYGLGLMLYLLAFIFAITLPRQVAVAVDPRPVDRYVGGLIADIRAGFRYALERPDIKCILATTIVFNIWGFPFVSMVPVIGREELGLTATWIGVLSAMEGLGAFLGALLVAAYARPTWFRRIYYFGTLAHLLLVFAAGWAPEALSMFTLFLLIGVASAFFGTMQSTLIYSLAPPEMRGRLYGLVVICIGTGLIGYANVGLMGELFGGSNAIKIIAAEGLIPLLLISRYWERMKHESRR